MAKTIRRIYQAQKIEAEKNGDKDGKLFYKLMNNAVKLINNNYYKTY